MGYLFVIFVCFMLCTFYLACIYPSKLIDKCIFAGTTEYATSTPCIKPNGSNIFVKGCNSENSFISIATQNGPLYNNDPYIRYWEKGEYLICKKNFGRCTNGHFYIMNKGNSYRIVQCQHAMNTYDNSIFNVPTETVVAEVVAIYNKEIKRVDYTIGHNTDIIHECDWNIFNNF